MKPNADIMKKLFTLSIIALFSVSLFAQRAQVPAALKNMAVKSIKASDVMSTQGGNILVQPHTSKAFSEAEVGQTVYDLMTNRSCYNRTYLHPDGTIATVWTMGQAAPSYADRGTGYNYFDPTLPVGSQWLSLPSARIESVRTGFPSYAPIGAGELVVCHSATQLVMSKRDTKGTGAWTQTLIPFTAGTEPTWPRVCVVGNSIHVICVDYTTAQLWYSRSTDGGTTWDKQGVEIPGLEKAIYYPNGFDADAYDWANPVGNTIAFIVGDKATDLVLMKSTDNGDTWTKTIIFQHPYPMFVQSTTLVLDTPYVCDASHAIALDASGNAYVAFGISAFLNDDLTATSYSWFPGTDGLAFWKEGQPTITNADPNELYLQCKLVGYLQDIDGSGVVLDNATATSIADYQVGCTSMPQILVGNDGNLYLIFKSMVETMMSTGGQFYNHIWGRKSTDLGETWSTFRDITNGPDHELVECIYPSMSPTSDGNIHFTYMSDFEPGTTLGGDADPAGTNSIFYATEAFTDFSDTVLVCTVGMKEVNLNGSVSIYPNPVNEYMDVNFDFNKSSVIKMNIYNAIGSLVKSESFVAGRGDTKRINTKDLANGIYMVKFETSNGTITNKIIKN